MKFIIALFINLTTVVVMNVVKEGTEVFGVAGLIFLGSLWYMYRRIENGIKGLFGSGSSKSTSKEPKAEKSSKSSEPKHERRPVIHAEGFTQVVRQERLGFEKWKVVYGTFGKNGQRNEIGSSTITPSLRGFTSGSDHFSITWA